MVTVVVAAGTTSQESDVGGVRGRSPTVGVAVVVRTICRTVYTVVLLQSVALGQASHFHTFSMVQ